jgi:hypothetical protein
MGITIAVVAGQDAATSRVSAAGSVQHIITDAERGTFDLGDAQLKAAVEAYFGKRPNDAFLHSPTPWNDLYATYGWPQVQTVLAVQRAEIISLTSQPIIMKTQEFDNTSSKRATFNVAINDEVSNTVGTSWSTGGTLSVGEEIEVGVDFIADAKSKTSISYSQSWGVGGQQSKTVTVGSNSGLSVDLEPGESVVAELSASRGVLKVRITYVASLHGNTAVNYNPTWKDHHFWSFGIGSVMAARGASNAVISTQDLEVGYYSNAKVALRDRNTGILKAVRMLSDAAAPMPEIRQAPAA